MKILYTCPICKKSYNTPQEAQNCLDQPFETKGWKVGDWVLCPSIWHGWIEDERWLAFVVPANPNSTDHFDRLIHYHAWYVITAITNYKGYDEHRACIHLTTGAYKKGDLLQTGWTIPFRRHEDPSDKITHSEIYRSNEIKHFWEGFNVPKDLVLPDKPINPEVLAIGLKAVEQKLIGELL